MAFFKRCLQHRLNFFSVVGYIVYNFLGLSATALKIFNRCRLQRLTFFSDIGDSVKILLVISATALKSTKWRLSSLAHQLFDIFCLVPKSPIHAGLIRAKNPEPNNQAWAPLRSTGTDSVPQAYVAWRDGTSNKVVVPARQAGNRFQGYLKG
jgi:hypothetical protein